VGDSSKHATLLDTNNEHFEVVHASTTLDILASLADQQFHCIYFFPTEGDSIQLAKLIQSEQILEGMPDGAALIDEGNSILWANDRMEHWCGDRCVDGQNFYAAFDQPDILGPDFCPFHTAITTGEESVSTLRSKDDQYFHVHAAPVIVEGGERARHLIVTVRDVTTEMLQQQKMAAIHKAGIELTNLSAEEIFEMAIEDRIELLKSNILHFTQNLLKFDVVEIRLLDQRTGELIPLLSEGINSENAKRDLYARPMDNGVTGFVAATGNSYLCEDTIEDPLYLEGHIGAKSSLTVPLIQHDQVIGTFNVESPQPHAFSENDLQFLEIFSRDVAVALNTLELLVAQQANTAQASVEAIHGKVALPVDEILNDAVNVMERYIGHESTVVKRLQRILRNARDIKQVIQRVGEEMTPAEAVAKQPQEPVAWPRLRGRRILVADVDESVRVAAHSLLERYGCIVETAHEGEETVLMVRNTDEGAAYDVIIADIRLPDMNGYELLLKLQQTLTFVPLVLMSGFGYDPGHSIVKARQAGLLPNAILYKPFRLDQLLATVDGIIENVDKVTQA
jgi:CheY-like chemotaxis protein